MIHCQRNIGLVGIDGIVIYLHVAVNGITFGIEPLKIDIRVTLALIHPDNNELPVACDSDTRIVLLGGAGIIIYPEISFVSPGCLASKTEDQDCEENVFKYRYFHTRLNCNKNARRSGRAHIFYNNCNLLQESKFTEKTNSSHHRNLFNVFKWRKILLSLE